MEECYNNAIKDKFSYQQVHEILDFVINNATTIEEVYGVMYINNQMYETGEELLNEYLNTKENE